MTPTDLVTEWWAKNGVEAIVIEIKRKWPKLCRKRVCNPASISRNQLECGGRESEPKAQRISCKVSGKEKKNLRRIHFGNAKCRVAKKLGMLE